MNRALVLALAMVSLCWSALAVSVADAGHCCGCKHTKCVICQTCCNCGTSKNQDRGSGDKETKNRGASRSGNVVGGPVMLIPSMPMYPMMYPVAPVAAVSRGESDSRGYADCCDRVDRLERQMKELSEQVHNLQVLMKGQNEVLEALAKQKADKAGQ